jgi:hypothetical protein
MARVAQTSLARVGLLTLAPLEAPSHAQVRKGTPTAHPALSRDHPCKALSGHAAAEAECGRAHRPCRGCLSWPPLAQSRGWGSEGVRGPVGGSVNRRLGSDRRPASLFADQTKCVRVRPMCPWRREQAQFEAVAIACPSSSAVRTSAAHAGRLGATASMMSAAQRCGSSRKGAWLPGITSRRACGISSAARRPISGPP